MGKCGGGVSCQSFLVVGFIIKITINAVGTQESHTRLAQALPSSNMEEAVRRPWDREGKKWPPGSELTSAPTTTMGEEVDRCSQDTAATLWNAAMWEAALELKVAILSYGTGQRLVLTRREELPAIIWCRNEAVTAGQLTWATGSTCPACSWSDGADASHCTHFLSWCFLFWILWFLATWSSWYMAVGSGAVFTCKSYSCNKSKEKILSKSAERFWHYFMKHNPWKVSTSKGIIFLTLWTCIIKHKV